MTAQAGRIVLQQCPSATTAPGHCRWCGDSLTQDAIERARMYCDQRDGRDCRSAYRSSYANGPREALIPQARAADEALRCDECGAELATFSARRLCVGIRTWEADYRVPLADGGRHTLENLRARCRTDHRGAAAAQTLELAHAR